MLGIVCSMCVSQFNFTIISLLVISAVMFYNNTTVGGGPCAEYEALTT